MKLFTPSQAISASEERAAREALRIQTLTDSVKELLKLKVEAEEDFEKTMKSQQKEAEEFFAAKVKKSREIEAEVLLLEERRKEALSPLIEREASVQLREESVEKKETELEEKADRLEEGGRLLMQRLDELTIKGQSIEEDRAMVERMKKGALTQKEQISQDARLLNERLQEFRLMLENKEVEFAHRQSELDARKRLYDENDIQLTRRERQLEEEKTRLLDLRFQLEKGFEELRRKRTNG